ncbi:hypothetical protein M2271_007243 [Streptomyces sp. LBL]|nr:hypothetical protein [Streptomyces sp. LBL]
MSDFWRGSSWGEARPERLSSDDLLELAKMFEYWAGANPRADAPVLLVEPSGDSSQEDASGLTPRHLAQALTDESSPWHGEVVRLFSVGLCGFESGLPEALHQLSASLSQDVDAWRKG